MENNTNNQFSQNNPNPKMQYHPPVPNATAGLVLGILSIVFSFCYGIVGLILGIVGLIQANKAIQLYESNPDAYYPSSYENAKAGRVTSIIGLVLSSLVFIYIIFVLVLIGSVFSTIPWHEFN